MKKEDLTEQCDNELVLVVNNDEWLYNQRTKSNFLEVIDELFIYTSIQLDILREGLKNE